MKTYSESQNKKPFNWNEFLDGAITNGVNDNKLALVVMLSSSWVTCACGNQCDIIPRENNHSPQDFELRSLGVEFTISIEDKDFIYAKQILQEIEYRSFELINEIQNAN